MHGTIFCNFPGFPVLVGTLFLNLYAQVVENIFAMTVTGKSSLLW